MVDAATTEDPRPDPRPKECGVAIEGAGPDPAALWREFAGPLRGFLARRVPPGVDVDDLHAASG